MIVIGEYRVKSVCLLSGDIEDACRVILIRDGSSDMVFDTLLEKAPLVGSYITVAWDDAP